MPYPTAYNVNEDSPTTRLEQTAPKFSKIKITNNGGLSKISKHQVIISKQAMLEGVKFSTSFGNGNSTLNSKKDDKQSKKRRLVNVLMVD